MSSAAAALRRVGSCRSGLPLPLSTAPLQQESTAGAVQKRDADADVHALMVKERSSDRWTLRHGKMTSSATSRDGTGRGRSR